MFGPAHFVLGLVLLALGVLLGIWLRKRAEQKANQTIADAEQKALQIENDAHKRAESKSKEMMLEAKEEAMRVRNEAEKENKERRTDLQKQERRLQQKEENIDKKTDALEKKEEALTQKHAALDKETEEIKIIKRSQTEMLERISGFTADDAKKYLIEQVESEVTHETALKIKEIEQRARDEADARAREIIATAVQRCAADHAAEITVSVVPLPNDEMKGRIIGREGRNIRALESLTGVEIIIDDSPDAILISGFDPIRREIARLSLQKLVTDGRIHPARIEEVVHKVEKQVEQEIIETGKRTSIDLGIHNLNPEIIKMVGRMKYRTSYGQNLLQHSIETAKLCATMAAELGLNVKAAKRAGFLHDIGKVAENEEELPHAILGMKVAERFKEKPDICNAIGAHHDEIEMDNLISPIVQVCDAISGARPGARREVVEAYIQRLNKLEEMAMSYPGVVKTYAIQAGRELRVIVGADKVTDQDADRIAYDLSKQIQTEMTYPGQIKITVIRETRAVQYAK